MLGYSFLLLCAITLLEIPQVSCQILMLDLAPNAFDDQYMDCADEMYEKISSTGLLQKELSRNAAFNLQWSQAEKEWSLKKDTISLPKDFRDEYGIAIVAYTGDGIYRQFNKAVRAGGKSYEYYMKDFHFKSLHFYLTMGLQLLRKSCRTNGQTVYRGIRNIQFVLPSGSKTIRFGQFTSTSLNRQKAASFGKHSFFTMNTCFGIKIAPFSFIPTEDEVLNPLKEVFTVTKYTEQGNQYILNSTQMTCCKYNCEYLRDTSVSSFETTRIARSADGGKKARSELPYCIYNSAPGGAGVMTSLLFGGFLVLLNTASQMI